jgi:hypothetical protein
MFFQVLRPRHRKRRQPQKLVWTTQLMILASHTLPMTTHSSRGHEERKSSKKMERRRKTTVGFLLHLRNCNFENSRPGNLYIKGQCQETLISGCFFFYESPAANFPTSSLNNDKLSLKTETAKFCPILEIFSFKRNIWRIYIFLELIVWKSIFWKERLQLDFEERLRFFRKLVGFFPAHMLLFLASMEGLSKKSVVQRKVSEIFLREFFSLFAQIEK